MCISTCLVAGTEFKVNHEEAGVNGREGVQRLRDRHLQNDKLGHISVGVYIFAGANGTVGTCGLLTSWPAIRSFHIIRWLCGSARRFIVSKLSMFL